MGQEKHKPQSGEKKKKRSKPDGNWERRRYEELSVCFGSQGNGRSLEWSSFPGLIHLSFSSPAPALSAPTCPFFSVLFFFLLVLIVHGQYHQLTLFTQSISSNSQFTTRSNWLNIFSFQFYNMLTGPQCPVSGTEPMLVILKCP